MFVSFYNYFLSKDKVFVRMLTGLLGFVPRHINYYSKAFVHKSFTTEKDASIFNNERLEYLGDAVLGTIVAEYLFKKYPTKDEGFMTMMRSKIVNRKSLSELADKMGLDMYLRMQAGNNAISETMLGNAFEAMIGAVYMDVGYEKTKKFILSRVLKEHFNVTELENLNTNYKSQLLEHCQKKHLTLDYPLLEVFKQNRRDKFRVAVVVNGRQVAVGEDFNKKSAEQIASEKALKELGVLEKAV